MSGPCVAESCGRAAEAPQQARAAKAALAGTWPRWGCAPSLPPSLLSSEGRGAAGMSSPQVQAPRKTRRRAPGLPHEGRSAGSSPLLSRNASPLEERAFAVFTHPKPSSEPGERQGPPATPSSKRKRGEGRSAAEATRTSVRDAAGRKCLALEPEAGGEEEAREAPVDPAYYRHDPEATGPTRPVRRRAVIIASAGVEARSRPAHHPSARKG
jgi:hypothetical protein